MNFEINRLFPPNVDEYNLIICEIDIENYNRKYITSMIIE